MTDSGCVHGGYFDTILTMVRMLEVLNKADSETARTWQYPYDASQKSAYGKLNAALRMIAGDDLVDHWCETGEVDLEVASRSHLAT